MFKNFNLISKLFFMFWVGILIVVSFYGEAFLPEKYFRDSEILMEMTSGGMDVENQGSYYFTTLVFGLFSENILKLLVLTIGVLYLFIAAKYCNTVRSSMLASILILPHVLLGMSRPQKEVLVSLLVIFIVISLGRLASQYKLTLKNFLIIVAFSYLTYSVVRNYYFLIIVFFLLTFIYIHKIKVNYKPLFIFILFGASFFIPDYVFQILQGTRDVFNSLRPVGVGHETVYFNPFEPNNIYSFVLNYIHAFFNFNFPVIFSFNFNTIYLQLYMVIVFYIILSERLTLLKLLFLSHIAILLLFEPDLGSYMRHLSSVCLYLIPSIPGNKNERIT